ncbi:AgmX/PglI C-terminal domain-containing protein [Nannocystis sp.]|uniref:AgmX/PglI C-terminal domain-containing protein n=1 Tax=Nannocystis sp. TaxID=1962667 RepID=UPI0025FB896B|nr:AgmX/PglI C-terminal domain-containing protein [Nannocystis sp.]MBK7829339.1 AgmX/PglI C-terminal domain-containing protein [Nannocystis sp.]
MTIKKTWLLSVIIAVCAGTAHAGDGTGTIDKDKIREVVRAHIVEIRECYNATLASDPEAQGRVVIDFTIGPQGTVTQAAVGSSDMGEVAAPTCMRDAIQGWVFPAPSGGSVKVSYPFLLEPG